MKLAKFLTASDELLDCLKGDVKDKDSYELIKQHRDILMVYMNNKRFMWKNEEKQKT